MPITSTHDPRSSSQSVNANLPTQTLAALDLVSKGFHELKSADPALAYDVLVEILSGIHESEPLRRHLNSSTEANGKPLTLVKRTTTRTADGMLVVTEHEEEIHLGPTRVEKDAGKKMEAATTSTPVAAAAPARSPIADMLYMRWMEGLKLRWPGGSS